MWSVAGIKVSFHRIGLTDWTPSGVLRSWAEAHWQPTPGGVAIACLPTEALWLGFSDNPRPAMVVLTCTDTAETARLQVPLQWQLGFLVGADAQNRPITLRNAASSNFRLDVQQREPTSRDSFELVLMSPLAWKTRFGPIDIAAAEPPAVVPAYSRIVRPKTGPPR
ncbi:hypothetical protein [Aquabacterium sp. CECT 9606]|uniref:hypothetical protein n=1 Tax=Aquabacterium sp. CECT 9606 TaxID=2845822 RepID=UPI001E2E354C|nr:hypothetical protein [Aquabacterium sp. CECT 9606]